ncbi:MAG: rod shape-determining protein MreC [Sporichthyaceae bacterium]
MIRDTATTRAALGVLLTAALSVAIVDSRGQSADSPAAPIREVAAGVLAPLQSVVATLARPLTASASALSDGQSQGERVAELVAANTALQLQVRELEAAASAGREVADLTTLGSAVGLDLRMARVIAVNAGPAYAWTVAIDVGAAHGVVQDATVLSAGGLVGRIVSVGRDVSTVLLVADPIFTVGVRMVESGELGTLAGAGEDLPRLTLFNRNARVAPGDRLVTVGSPGGRPFAPDVVVGEVATSVGAGGQVGQLVTVRPYARMTALDVVAVVVESPASRAMRASEERARSMSAPSAPRAMRASEERARSMSAPSAPRASGPS